MLVLVCGGREFQDADFVWRTLEDVNATTPGGITEIMASGTAGADTLAEEWAKARGVACHVYLAIRLGRAAGPIRNQAMIEAKPDLVIAYPGGRGTDDMMRRARAAGVAIRQPSFEANSNTDAFAPANSNGMRF